MTAAEAPIHRLLSRLEAVKSTGPQRWVALCPSHPDKRPSLSIRETGDGRVLVHCWAGCAAADVVAAIGLSLADLFEKPIGHHVPPERRPWPALDVLRGVAFELRVAFAAGAGVLAGEPLTAADLDRLGLAVERIDAALCLAEGVRRG